MWLLLFFSPSPDISAEHNRSITGLTSPTTRPSLGYWSVHTVQVHQLNCDSKTIVVCVSSTIGNRVCTRVFISKELVHAQPQHHIFPSWVLNFRSEKNSPLRSRGTLNLPSPPGFGSLGLLDICLGAVNYAGCSTLWILILICWVSYQTAGVT